MLFFMDIPKLVKRNLLKNNIKIVIINNNCKRMSKRPINVELPEEVWKIIDTQFKLHGESDSEILSNIIKNHLAQNGYYPDADSLIHGHGLKDKVDIQQDMIM